MSFTTGTTVQTNDFTNLKELKDLLSSGFYSIQIVNAMYYKGTSKSTGNEYHQCRLSCKATNMQTKEVGKLSFSFFLPSVELNHFCYFLNLKVENDQYGLPDPTHKEGMSKATGQPYGFDHFPTIEGLSCFVLLESEGLSTRNDGTNYAQFKVVAFTDNRGRSALDVLANSAQPNKEILEFFQKIEQEQRKNQISQPIKAQIAQAQTQHIQQASQQAPQQAMTQNPQAQAMYGLNNGQSLYAQAQQQQGQSFNMDGASLF